MDATVEQVKERFQRFAKRECKDYSLVYYRLAHSVALNDELTAFIAGMPDQQPNLFLAAVQYLTGPNGMPTTGKAMSHFVKEHAGEVAGLMRSHRTQTNEVGRCAALLPAMPAGPLALVEVGASAGLCLMLDRFHYDYGTIEIGDETSPVRLHCTLKGHVEPPSALPRIAWRSGLDIEPVDLNDPARARWLMAYIWPDHLGRRTRLEAAIRFWEQDAPPVWRGDLIEGLPALLAEVPLDATLVVFHSAVLPYVSPERRQAFAALLRELSKQRDIVWVSYEGRGALPHIDALAPSLKRGQFLVARTTLRAGSQEVRLVGIAHAHGSDFQWLVETRRPRAHPLAREKARRGQSPSLALITLPPSHKL